MTRDKTSDEAHWPRYGHFATRSMKSLRKECEKGPSGEGSQFGRFEPHPGASTLIVSLVRRNGGTLALKGPGDGAGEDQMGDVGL